MASTEAARDYPYYDDRPVGLGWIDWAIILAALALGFYALGAYSFAPWVGAFFDGVVRASLFVGLPLAALAWRAGGHWRAIFHGFRWSYVGWGLLFGLLNLVFTYVIGMIAVKHMDLASNAMIHGLRESGTVAGLWQVYLTTGIQLFGEELITILPFLFLLWLCTAKLGLSRLAAVVIAWIGSALLFGAIHLPTYDWNLIQALLLIGPVRLVLTLAYLKTKSIWASTVAHVFNDWTMFTLAVVLGGAAG